MNFVQAFYFTSTIFLVIGGEEDLEQKLLVKRKYLRKQCTQRLWRERIRCKKALKKENKSKFKNSRILSEKQAPKNVLPKISFNHKQIHGRFSKKPKKITHKQIHNRFSNKPKNITSPKIQYASSFKNFKIAPESVIQKSFKKYGMNSNSKEDLTSSIPSINLADPKQEFKKALQNIEKRLRFWRKRERYECELLKKYRDAAHVADCKAQIRANYRMKKEDALAELQ